MRPRRSRVGYSGFANSSVGDACIGGDLRADRFAPAAALMSICLNCHSPGGNAELSFRDNP
jgi:hypothetical protein